MEDFYSNGITKNKASLSQSLDLHLLSPQPMKRHQKNLMCWKHFKTTTILVQKLHGCCGCCVAQFSE